MPYIVPPTTPMTTTTPVNARTAPRRDVYYKSIDELAADLDRIEAAIGAGTIASTGNWTPGQNMQHVGLLIKGSYEGMPFSMPAPVRFLARLLLMNKVRRQEKPPPAGMIKLPKSATFLQPDPAVIDREGLEFLRAQLERIRAGERMTHPSPLLGKMTHDDWVSLHRKHASLHLSFIDLG